MECGACMSNCPEGALTVRAGVGCAAAVFNGLLQGGEPNCDCGGPSGSDSACCG
jgi:ferredoxin